MVTDTLPPGVSFVSVTPGAPACNEAGGVVTCNLGSLGPIASTTITIVVVPNAAGTITNTATVTGNEPDLNSTNDQATATTAVVVPGDALPFFTVTSTHGQNFLEWLNPAIGPSYVATRILFKAIPGSSACSFPSGPSDATATLLPVPPGVAGTHDTFLHAPLPNDNTTYCYAAFVEEPGPTFSAGRFTKGRPFGLPFDTTPGVKWAYSTGATSMVPPGIGPAAYTVSNDRALHSMVRGTGATGGDWPVGWTPWAMNGPAQSRPPVVPTTAVPGATRVVFLGSQDGHVYAVNADTGSPLWQSPLLGDVVQAAPAGIFTAFGGAFDYILVGTRNSSPGNRFYALKVSDGTVVGTPFDGGSATALGIISAGAAVDYPNRRVYFASRAGTSSNTLWCLDITAAGVSFAWAKPLGNIDGGPVLRSGRVYVGTNTGTVFGVDALDGNNAWSFSTGDGAVKGFIFPDRDSARLYLATTNKVWGLTDMIPTPNWPVVLLPAPSIPLFIRASPFLYVGGSDGRLYELDLTLANAVTSPTVKSVPLGDSLAGVGPPSFDFPNALIYAGSEGGVVYAVQFPLP